MFNFFYAKKINVRGNGNGNKVILYNYKITNAQTNETSGIFIIWIIENKFTQVSMTLFDNFLIWKYLDNTVGSNSK